MTTNLIKNIPDRLSKVNYSVLVEAKEGGYQATVWGLPDCQVFAATRENALLHLHELVIARLQNVEIITQEIEVPKSEHPWMKFAGMYQDNPLFNEVVSNIEAYRRELDTEMDTEDEI
ncbi:type II toxin-antitoxin system HicB family antitoxin [Scytonema sp. UIC 10036]|uniref:type II toxin-antitoxin system HicB family antitoxin n=1 Tax=Scytonema sp. UIC 10036 TaxID=2304196 RepID=UPI0012DAE0AF|nr:type II toxin-antitoxin system HicB family antitoxin [Scytonema sp. UIC 10036]MUG97015.1 type II toxin-antitoxin system HicB family antitoxin [Scytonema sp. UIC 10036]